MEEDSIVEYVILKDGKIDGHFDGESIPLDGIAADNFIGFVGDDERFYDWLNNGVRFSDEYLIVKGIIEDNRGTWYRKTDKYELIISLPGIELPDGYTDIKPINIFDDWVIDRWVNNQILQDEYDNQKEINTAQGKVDNALAKACDGFAYLFLKYIPTLTQGEKDLIQEFRDKYTVWKDLQ